MSDAAPASTWSQMLAVWRDDDSPAVIASGATWSGSELLHRAGGASTRLRSLTPPGPLPALVASSPAAIAHLIAGAECGRPLAPLGPKLTADELQPVIESLGAEVVLADHQFGELAAELSRRTGCGLVWLETPDPGEHPLELAADPSAVAFVLHTSGTTGLPKAVPYVQRRLVRRCTVNSRLAGLGPGCVYASASGFHHIAGLGNYVVALAVGAAVAPLAGFSLETWTALADLRVTHALTVPTMLEMLLDAGALQLPGLRTLLYGASPIHPETLRRTMAAIPGVRLVNIFGQTEGSPITCLTSEDHDLILREGRDDLLLSVGRAAPGVEVRIADPDDSGVGEVLARADHLMLIGEDGWLHTGDLGRLNAEGYLFLEGRRGDKIIRGGENVYPLEVERVLETHPGVREAAVVGVPDRRWGETVKAVVVPTDPLAPPSADELRSYTRAKLAGFKVPVDWSFVDQLPRNANGKLLRRELTAIGGAARERP